MPRTLSDTCGAVSLSDASYMRGTKILTRFGEMAIENLSVGDAIVTRFHGFQRIKWIGRQSFAARFIQNNTDRIPVRISARALGPNLPAFDLYVSPGHSILLGDVLVPARALINNVSITQKEMPEEVHYYNIEFEAHDCVLAENCWSESYADMPGHRTQFHNTAEFYKLYPDQETLAQPVLCAPKPEHGLALEAALRPAAARASAVSKCGRLMGRIDKASEDGTIEGWAYDDLNPELPVLLNIVLQDHVIGTALACHYRKDLAEAGYGRGRCMFRFTIPRSFLPKFRWLIHICRTADGMEIFMRDNGWAKIEISGISPQEKGVQRTNTITDMRQARPTPDP